MNKSKLMFARLCLIMSILAVIMTVINPINKRAIGKLFSNMYNGYFSVGVVIVALIVFFGISKHLENDIWINRFKFLLSFSFLMSLVSNVIWKA